MLVVDNSQRNEITSVKSGIAPLNIIIVTLLVVDNSQRNEITSVKSGIAPLNIIIVIIISAQ